MSQTALAPHLHRPIAAGQRLHVLDVLRGFALLGIVLANVQYFAGLFFLEMVGAVASSPLDEAVHVAIEVLVHGKFYSLFSLLFGIGCALFLGRAEAKGLAARPLFRRRLWILLGIGGVHALLLWAGDILMIYALLGFALVPFYGRSSRTLLTWATGLLALPIVAYAVMWAAGITDPLAPPPADPGAASAPEDGFNPILFMITGFQGGYLDVLGANLVQLVGRWVDVIMSFRLPRVLGLFVLGLWVGQRGLLHDLEAHAGLLRRVAAWGLGLGLALNGAMAYFVADVAPFLPGSPLGMAEVVVGAVGVPVLMLGYTAGIALLMRSGGVARVLMRLAPVGRMALTNYLLQTVICMVLFYGLGFGLYGQVGTAAATAIGLAIFVVQVPLSQWWLGRYRFGPAEWVWRRLTYRVPLALRHADAAVPGSPHETSLPTPAHSPTS
ncbi:MAG: DUF418 domain-containing protein [Bacteroidota bacterium]